MNQASAVTKPADQTATEGGSFALQVGATDPDGDTLSYEASGPPAGLSIDVQGKISGTVESGAAANSPYQATVKATDPGGLSDSKSFTFTVNAPSTEPGKVIYRVNAGGPKQTGTPEWGADTQLNLPPYVNTVATGNRLAGTSATIDMSDPSIPAGTPEAVFKRERWDPSEALEMAWAFPVDPGTYQVRLYFAETFSTIDAPGKRVFDVLAEGETRLDNYDVFAETGAINKGSVETLTVASDGTLNIDLAHGATQHAAIKSIEVLSSTSTGPLNEPPVGVDTVKPTISKPSPSPNAKIRNHKPTISAIVRDRGSELMAANIEHYVDGKRVKFSYNQETDRLVYKSKVLSFGKHTVKLVATDDPAKNKAVKSWRYQVIRGR